jgi:hypothetical protein
LTQQHCHELQLAAVLTGFAKDDKDDVIEPMPVLLKRAFNVISDASEALTKFLILSANITGSDPHRKELQTGFQRKWYTRHVLRALFELPARHGGNMPFDTNEENGGGRTFNEAVEIVEYLILGDELSETNRFPWPSFSTVRRIRDEVRKEYKQRNAKEKKV